MPSSIEGWGMRRVCAAQITKMERLRQESASIHGTTEIRLLIQRLFSPTF